MAVFPDRIVLKNSADGETAIVAAIETGGTDEITQGEIVLGISNSAVKFYTKAGDGNIVSLGGTGTGAQSLGDLVDVDLSTPATDGQVIVYSASSGNWEPSSAPPANISGNSIGDLSDVDTTTSAPVDGQVLIWNNVDGEWQPGNSLSEVISDTTPQLGGNLDVNGNQIVSTSGGDIEIAPDTTGGLVVRGNNTDGKIKLNCIANTHGVTIQSPPHANAADYTLILPSDAGSAGQVLTSQGGAQLTWEDAGSGGGATSIDDLSDVDTSTTPPTTGQILEWNGTNWVPGEQTGGSGGSGSTGTRLSEGQTASSGIATFTGLGHSGTFVSVTSSLNAWIVFYGSAADRTSDAGRFYSTDPTTGSGVLAEFYITAGSTVLATPGTTYFNNDTSVTEALYVAVRDQAGASVDSLVTVVAYGDQTITSVSGGTFGSGI